MRILVIAGAGGHGQVVADVAAQTGMHEEIVFADNAYERGVSIGSWNVSFHDEDLSSLNPATTQFILGLGQVTTGVARRNLYKLIIEFGLTAATLVAPNASVSKESTVGPGSLIGFMSTVNIGAAIGANVIVNTRAVIEHDAAIADHAHISTGAIVNGGATVGHHCLIGSGATVLQGVSICDDVIVGAGTVVTRDIDSPGTYVGAPARKIHD